MRPELNLEALARRVIYSDLIREKAEKKQRSEGDLHLTLCLNHLPLNEALKQDLKICIVDHNSAEMRVSWENYSKIETLFFDYLFQSLTMDLKGQIQ